MLYTQYLVQAIGTKWRAEVPEWVGCESNLTNPFFIQQPSMDIITKPSEEWSICPESILNSLEWTAEVNVINCANVWKGYKRKYEIGGPYYTENIPIAEKLLAKAGVRMAHVINHLATLY
jgi:hypothetical protein